MSHLQSAGRLSPNRTLFRFAALSLFFCVARFSVGGSPTSDRTAVQAELVKAIEAGRVQVGDPIYAKVQLAWNDAACKLREGAILKGRVVAQTARSKTAKTSEIALLFEKGQCGGREMKPLPLTLTAVLAPDPTQSLFEDQESKPLSDATGLALGQQGSGSPMRSVLAAAATVMVEPPHPKPPQIVMPGQVVGIRNVTLAVGRGPEGSSILSSPNHNMRLDSGSRLVLVPSAIVTAAPQPPESHEGNANNSAQPTGNNVTPRETPDESDVCLPPSCTVALNADPPETDLARADLVIPVKQLGLTSPVDREMYHFGHESTISYLGPNQLLLTFNPHQLVVRTSAEAHLPKLYVVRAIVIDLSTMKTVRIVDWRIHDAQQYLWSLGGDAVLVHVGADLRVYGPDLKLERKFALGGPLAFATVDPSGSYIAAGIVRERHTEAIHRELLEAEDREPEEDVEVRVLTREFHALVDVTRSSRNVPPVLSEDGEVRIPTLGKNRWRVVEYAWSGQRRVLKEFDSSCRPEAVSLPPNLLFLTGCDRLEDGKWYRLLRSDGTLILKGASPSSEQGHTAVGAAGSPFYAVGIDELGRPLEHASAFHSSDLKNLRIGIYRIDSGARVASMAVPNPVPMAQAYALSPNGLSLAILESEKILLYRLPGVVQRN